MPASSIPAAKRRAGAAPRLAKPLPILLALALAWPVVAPAAPAASADCDCADPYRAYTRQPTEDVLALFQAAATLNEARFGQLIAAIPDIAEYAVKGRPLLDVLLTPSPALLPAGKSWTVYYNLPQSEQQRIAAAHQAGLPAKTRMLALALRHGASASDVAYYARRPPLHSALLWGTPEMVALLLRHGADPKQRGDDGQQALEVALDPDMSRHVGFLPLFVTAEERTRMIDLLIQAGAPLPFQALDKEAGGARPSADAVIWPAVAAMTRGDRVMRQLARLGTTPLVSDGKDMSLAMAARTGNLDGLRWLKEHTPRQTEISQWRDQGWQKTPFDLWAQAACWALYPHQRFGAPGAGRDQVLTALITPDFPWLQDNRLEARAWDPMEPTQISFPEAGHTLLHHLVHAGDEAWVKRVIAMGAPVDGAPAGSRAPLAQAVLDGNVSMARVLLAAGADPLAGDAQRSPLFEIIKPRTTWGEPSAQDAERQREARRQILELMLARLTPAQKATLAAPERSPFAALFDNPSEARPELARALLQAGLPLPPLDGDTAASLMVSAGPELIELLLDHGLRLREAKAPRPLLAAAVGWDKALVARLIDAGADPNLPDKDGRTAVALAALRGDVATLDLLLAKGGRLDAAATPQSPETLDELAVRSRSEAMLARLQLRRIDLSARCFAGRPGLDGIVLDSSDAYWTWLLRRGFGRAVGGGCPSQPFAERLIADSLSWRGNYEAGWSGARLTARLADLSRIRPIPRPRGQALMATAQEQGREDVVRALQGVGFAAPKPRGTPSLPPATPAERQAMAKLAGDYYLSGVREVGSQIRLLADGRFAFMLAYGSVDQSARGQWRLRQGEVSFHTPKAAEADGWQPFRRETPPAPSAAVPADRLRIQVRYRDRPLSGIEIGALGCQPPARNWGETSDGEWEGPLAGAACQIVLRHPQLQGGRPYVYQVPPADRQAGARFFAFQAEPGKQDASQAFNVRMRLVDGKLQWRDDGRSWTYIRQ
ncbi:hypothetical protein CEK28_10235 [Xenophilus sp. AP218F]|nr:hypothetical protein CEK28_10235 [Xenophilus sp. AP218F]